MDKKIISILFVAIILVTLFSGCIEEPEPANNIPNISISYPKNKSKVSSLVMISGISTDLDGNEDIIKVEVKIEDDKWDKEKWNLTESTWKAIKKDITSYLDQQKEKYEINC